jgi:hypothetical protein
MCACPVGMTYIAFNRTAFPDLIKTHSFDSIPTMGHIYDANGNVLVELGKERREIIQTRIFLTSYGMRLSAKDGNFFSNS